MTIFWNLLLIKANETFISKSPEGFELFFTIFLNCNDQECSRLCIEIFGILSRYILLKDGPNDKEKIFLGKIVSCLEQEFENEFAVECIHNLMIN